MNEIIKKGKLERKTKIQWMKSIFGRGETQLDTWQENQEIVSLE